MRCEVAWESAGMASQILIWILTLQKAILSFNISPKPNKHTFIDSEKQLKFIISSRFQDRFKFNRCIYRKKSSAHPKYHVRFKKFNFRYGYSISSWNWNLEMSPFDRGIFINFILTFISHFSLLFFASSYIYRNFLHLLRLHVSFSII